MREEYGDVNPLRSQRVVVSDLLALGVALAVEAQAAGVEEVEMCNRLEPRAHSYSYAQFSPLVGPLVVLRAEGDNKAVAIVVEEVVKETPSRSQSVSVVFILG